MGAYCGWASGEEEGRLVEPLLGVGEIGHIGWERSRDVGSWVNEESLQEKDVNGKGIEGP